MEKQQLWLLTSRLLKPSCSDTALLSSQELCSVSKYNAQYMATGSDPMTGPVCTGGIHPGLIPHEEGCMLLVCLHGIVILNSSNTHCTGGIMGPMLSPVRRIHG